MLRILAQTIIKSNERSEYSYIGLAGLAFFKRKVNSTTEQQKCKGYEKRDRLLISKMEINYQISQRNKSFAF